MQALLLALLALGFAVACKTPQSDSGLADDTTPAADFRLPGYDESILVGDRLGKLAVIRVGDSWSHKTIASTAAEAPTEVRTHAGRFYALYPDGSLAVIDPSTGTIERTITLSVPKPASIELAGESEAYVTSASTGKLVKVDLASGTATASLDLGNLAVAGGAIELHRIARVDGRLFVQVARKAADQEPARGALAVVDLASLTLTKVIELEARGSGTSAPLPGLKPDLPMAFDGSRGHLYVSLLGDRPNDTGMLVRIDTATLAVHDALPADAGFQGVAVFQTPFERLFMIYHTSTPVTSSHLFHFTVDDAGTLTEGPGATLVDTFDGLDALAINPTGTLVAMANHCLVGFCFGGAGITFIDARTSTMLPKLMADRIGFQPAFVQFK